MAALDYLSTPSAPRGLSSVDYLNAPAGKTVPYQVADGLEAGELEKGLHRGLSTIANTGQAALGQLIQPLAPDAGTGLIQGAVTDQNAMGQRYAPAVPTWDDVHGLYDTALYGAGKFGEMAPLMPLGMAGGLAGRVAGGLAGSELGAAASFLPVNMGDEAMRLHQDPAAAGLSPGQKLLHSGAVGGIQSLLEGAVPAGAINRYVTPAAMPRSLGAAARGLAGDFVKGTAAGSAEEGLQEVVSQAGQFAYNPNAKFDPAAIEETLISSAFGMAPMAGAHAVTAAATDAVGGGALKGWEVGKKTGEALAGGAKYVGQAAYDAMSPEAQARLDKVVAVAQSPAEAYAAAKQFATGAAGSVEEYVGDTLDQATTPDAELTTNAGRVAARVGSDAVTRIKEVADATLGVVEGAADSLHHNLRSDESRLNKTINDLAVPPTGDAQTDRLLDRGNFFQALSERYGPNSREKGMMTAAAAAIAELNTRTDMTKEEMIAAWGAVRGAATKLREELGGDKLKEDRAAVAAWLDKKDVKYSRMVDGATQYETKKAMQFDVEDNRISDTLEHAFKAIGWKSAEYAAERAEMGSIVRKFAKAMLEGKDASSDIRGKFRDVLHATFGDEAGKLEGAIFDSINKAKENGADGLTKGGADLYDFVKERIKDGAKPSAFTDILRLTRESDEQLQKFEGMTGVKIGDLPGALRELVQKRIDFKKNNGLPPVSVRELAIDVLRQDTDQQLRGMLKGSPDAVVQRLREMRHELSGEAQRELGVKGQHDDNRLNASEVGTATDGEGYDDEGKKHENTGLSITPAPAERDVDTSEAYSGHTTDEHGVGGEIGHVMRGKQLTSAPHSTSRAGGKNPARSDGSGHVEVDRVNVLAHVERMPRGVDETSDDVLGRIQVGVMKKEHALATKLRADLGSREDVDAALSKLEEHYNRAKVQRDIAKSNGDPQKAFDARAALEREYGADAQKISDLFWAEKKRDYDGSPREFFERFSHSFVTTRNNAGSGERMDAYDINKGIVTPKKAAKLKGEIKGPETGHLAVMDHDGNTSVIDVPEQMAHSLGKVRTRDEGLDELGNKERYDDNLIMPDGSINARYATDLRSAWANFAISLIDSDEHVLTPGTARIMMNPPDDLLLRRGVDGVGDVTWGDITQDTKRISFSEKQHDEIILHEPQATGLAALSKGVMSGTDRQPITSDGKPISLDINALIKHTAAALGVNMSGAPKQIYFAMLNEGIRALRADGVVDKKTLPAPVRGITEQVPKTKKNPLGEATSYTLNPQYSNLVIGDRTYRNEDDRLVSKAEDTLIKLSNSNQGMLKALLGASRLDADDNSRAIASLAGFAAMLEITLTKRAEEKDPALVSMLKATAIKVSEAATAYAASVAKGFKGEAEAARHTELNHELLRLTAEAQKLGASAEKAAAASTDADISRMSRDEKEAYERDGKQKYRENLDDKTNGELIAKLRSAIESIHDLSGWNQNDFIPDDGTTGRHEKLRGAPAILEVKPTGHKSEGLKTAWKEGDLVARKAPLRPIRKMEKTDAAAQAADHETGAPVHSVKTDAFRANQTIPITREMAENATVGKKLPGTLPISDKAQLDKAMTREKATAVVEAPVGLKADPKLQAFLDDISAGIRPTTTIEPHMLKAFYDEAGKLPQSRVRDLTMEHLTRAAAEENVDLATGQYKAGEEVALAKPVLYADGAKTGPAEAKLGAKGGLELWQGGKLVGKMMDGQLASAMKAGSEVSAAIVKKGAGFEANVSYFGEAKMMPEYKGADTLPAKKAKYSRLVLKDGTTIDGSDADAVVAHVNSIFGKKVADSKSALVDEFKNAVAGKTEVSKDSPLGFMITLSHGAKSKLGSTGLHESLHGLFQVLNHDDAKPSSKEAWAKLQKSLTGSVVQERLMLALDKLDLHPEARALIDKDINSDPEEAAAYAFQFWATGDLKLGPAGDGFFSQVGKFFRDLLGITTEYERSDAFMTAFLRGDLGKADFKASALEAAFAAKKGDEMLKAIGEHLAPFKEVMNTVFDSSIKAMERLNLPEATDLMRKFTGYGEGEGYIKRVNIESRKASTKAGAILAKHKAEDLSAGIKEIYDGEITSDAAKDVMTFVDDMNTYAGRPKGTLPTIFDHAKISKDRKAFDRAIEDFGTLEKGVSNKAVVDLISDLGFQLREGDKVDFLPQYANEKAKWMQTDPTMFMRSLIVSSVKKTEYGKIFKPGEVQETLQKIQAKGGDEAYHKAKQFVDGMEGRLGQNMNPGVRNMMKAVLTAGNVITLPFSIFSAAVDPFHLASRSNSLGDAGKAYAAGLGSIFKTVGSMFGANHENTPEENLAEEIGAIEHAMMVDVLGDTYLGDQAEGLTKKINDWFFKANMLDGWTRQMRVAAVTSGQRFILEHSDPESNNQHSAHFMEELGLKASDVTKDSEGNLVLNDAVKMALNKFVDESIVRPDQATNAIWMNDPRFMLLAHMKRFTYAFNDVVLARAMKEAHRGNLSPIAMLGASIPAILAADMGKHLLKGDYDTWMNNSTTSQWFDLGMNRAGLNGKLQFGMDAVHDVQMGGTPIDSAMGPDIGLVKKAFGTPHHAMAGSDMGLMGLADDAAMLAYQGAGLEDARQAKHKPKK